MADCPYGSAMLDIEHCKKLLPRTKLSDAQIAQVRDALYAMVLCVLDINPPKEVSATTVKDRKKKGDLEEG